MKYTCDYCFAVDAEPSNRYSSVSGDPICDACCIGKLTDNEPAVHAMYKHDIGYKHAAQVIERTKDMGEDELPLGPMRRMSDMDISLMKIHGMID